MSTPFTTSHLLSLLLVGMLVGVTAATMVASLTAERTETVFVYGTLTNPIIRTVMCRCFVGGEATSVEGYKKDGLNIIPTTDTSVAGQLITVSLTELSRLDEYEDVPDNYRRVRLSTHPAKPWVYLKQ